MTSTVSKDLDAQVIAYARVLPLDVVEAKGNGHAGTAVGLTPFLYVLFQEVLAHDPAAPQWYGRDRFVLSCGHTSLSLYVQLFLSGYGLEMDDLKAARTFGSITPGHPERGMTPGVETTTGPLGQGIANAVGMAMEQRRMRALLDPDAPFGESPFDHQVWCLASDGDIQEGVSHEASAIAGHLRLSNLVLVWDDNRISIEGDTAVATSEDVVARYRAYGFDVVTIDDAENLDAIRAHLKSISFVQDRPIFVQLRTRIGHPMPSAGGTARAHSGAVGPEEVARTKVLLGLDPDASFVMPDELLAHARKVGERGAARRAAWDGELDRWRAREPERAALYDRLTSRSLPEGWEEAMPEFPTDAPAMATRQANQKVLTALSASLPEIWGGSADLAETNGVFVPGLESFLPEGLDIAQWPGGPAGAVVHFGIREHAMAAIANGMALSGLSRPFTATFFAFSDYMRPAVRLSALMELPTMFVWSHDSVGVGEDGPTHQPVEHLWSLRAMPGLAVSRPADGNEVVGTWSRWLEVDEGPVGICLGRQALPVLPVAASVSREGARRGGYVVQDSESAPDVILIGTGSEVHLAIDAADILRAEGFAVRVVSMPCLEWFEQQPAEYIEAVLPPRVRARVSVEAGVAQGWYRWLGDAGRAVSVESFGHSGAGHLVMSEAGVHEEAVVAAAMESMNAAELLRGEVAR